MRSVTTSRPQSPLHRLDYVAAHAARLADLDAWRVRALRQATTVRRVLRAGGPTGTGAVGEAATLGALASGLVAELLLTPRFIDMNPCVSATVLRLARERKTRVSTVTGVAAFELDLVAGGIGAILRRSSAYSPGRRVRGVGTSKRRTV